MIEIDVKHLENGLHHYSFEVNPEDIYIEEFENAHFRDKVRVEIALQKWSDDFTLEGEIFARSIIECSRCLTPCDLHFHLPIKLYFKRKLKLSESDEAINLTEDDLITLSYDESTIELDGRIRETLILGIPLKVLCSENCQGLCPMCGINLNEETCDCHSTVIDPRWEKLRQLSIQKS
ncbi:MAG: DUF177 domain-containing protein [Gemmatimonadetes bacterium]|nr:MAG: DUF177 domain-containing protein [Gemmatimonadota bacterium]